MINRFSQFLIKEKKTVYFTFGRLNPPTMGHEMLLNKLAKAAGRNPYKIYLSKSSDPKKNPLSYNDKIKFARKMFPKHARQIIKDNNIKTIMDIAAALYKEGYVNIVMAVDGPRSREFDILLNKYNGVEGRHGFYNFKSIKFVNVGERDDSSEGIDGVSATKQRNAAKENDFVAFTQGLPKSMSNKDAKQLFNAVRKGMGLKEATEFKRHIQLEPVSDLREAYIRDNIFEQGEKVVITDKGIVGTIKHLGSNYLIVESKGETWRCWLDGVSKVDPNQHVTWTDAPYEDPGNDGIIREDYQPEWGTPQSTAKAKKTTPGQTEGAFKRIAQVQSNKADRVASNDKKGLETYKKKPKEEATSSAQDRDIADRPGSQPAKYHKGLSKAQKIARDRQFKRQTKMSHDDPKAYKPAPGDKTSKTKLSKHTLKYRKMFGEESDTYADIAKKRIEREKAADKRRHDRMMDRARLRDVKKINKDTT